ncbi:uncharacterized protein LOC132624806 [Lycium barbarum]|uniref:uncharacterized protein LOC132624806 n=1 Tax=Lycium barbarum TaxID=112863 RepID=UPI00293E3D70|nr:uncharacterized protein LOC132624806 [Lycium barbarum]
MVNFRGYTSPSSKLKYLIIESNDGGAAVQTKLVVHTPLTGWYAGSWPPLRNSLHMLNWTSECKSTSTRTSQMWSLQAPNHRNANIASALPSLGRRIVRGEVRWGETVVFEGEYCHIPGYWEWAEDTLSRSQEVLSATDIYDAIYASLFTYDRNSNILQAFCEAWCPKMNTLLTSVGELSISLWDLHTLGGLPIGGHFYEEVIPEAKELTGVDTKNQRYISRVCEYLFTAFHYLQEGRSDNPRVSLSKWIQFWYKRALKYQPAPPRREKKSARFKSTHNLTGAIPKASQWSREEEAVFHKLGVKPAKRDETYLAAFLSCWLCAFVLPSEEGNFIRPGTFKIATMMAAKRKISLAVPVLASIYSNLNNISRSSRLDLIKVRFPIHYIYGWLAYYFKTHFVLVNGPSNPLMVAYSGEGAARYFEKKDARKRIHQGDNVAWTSTMLNNSEPYNYVDNNDAQELELNYFMSVRFGYLSLRDGNSVIIEPYSPHRFSRQFGFYQKIPGALANDYRSASLAKGLQFWRICVLSKSISCATFPPITPNVKKLFADDYRTWWLKTHGNFLDDYFQYLVDAAGPISNALLKGTHQGCTIAAPMADDSFLPEVILTEKCKGKGSQLLIKAPTECLDDQGHQGGRSSFLLSKAAQASNKRSSRGESDSSYEDRCWRKVRPRSEKLEDTNLAVVKIPDSVDSPSRTVTTLIRKPNSVGALRRGKSTESGESVSGADLIKSSSIAKAEQGTTSIFRDKVKEKLSSDLHKRTSAVVSVFDGKKVVLNYRKMFISNLWVVIRDKLSGSDVDRLPLLKKKSK